VKEEFKIVYHWTKRAQPLSFSADDYIDSTRLYVDLAQFLSEQAGNFTIQFGHISLCFDVRPDLATIFFELPDALEKVATRGNAHEELNFYEQSTDIKFHFDIVNHTVGVAFEKGLSAGSKFPSSLREPIYVSRQLFLSEWLTFLDAVLAALRNQSPTLEHDQSYREYFLKLVHIKSVCQAG
jgi:hypothetical protein